MTSLIRHGALLTACIGVCIGLFGAAPAVHAQESSQTNETRTSANEIPTSISTTLEQVAPRLSAQQVAESVTGIPQVALHPRLGGGFPAGDGNVAALRQVGDANWVALQQYGGNNRASIYLEGDNNRIDARQLLGRNTLDLRIQGSGNDIPVRQINLLGRGNDLSLSLIGIDNVQLPFPITQIGGGIPIEVTIRR